MSTSYIKALHNIRFGPIGGITTPFLFEDNSALSYSFWDTARSLTTDGQLKFDEKGDTIKVCVTNLEAMAGDALCNQIDLVNFPWTPNLIPENDDLSLPYGGFTAAMLKIIDISEILKSV